MGKRIISSHSVTGTAGWWLTDDQAYFKRVAVWVLADVFDERYPSSGTVREVVGLAIDELGDVGQCDLTTRHYAHENDVQHESILNE